jgi:hypothetical protein
MCNFSMMIIPLAETTCKTSKTTVTFKRNLKKRSERENVVISFLLVVQVGNGSLEAAAGRPMSARHLRGGQAAVQGLLARQVAQPGGATHAAPTTACRPYHTNHDMPPRKPMYPLPVKDASTHVDYIHAILHYRSPVFYTLYT